MNCEYSSLVNGLNNEIFNLNGLCPSPTHLLEVNIKYSDVLSCSPCLVHFYKFDYICCFIFIFKLDNEKYYSVTRIFHLAMCPNPQV